MAQSKTAITSTRIDKIAIDVSIALLGSIFFAIVSQLAIPLPFTPVPLTLQTFGLFLLGGTLGSRRAAYSVILYLAQASLGLPVLAGGIANPLWFLDCKAGFLLSFVAAAFLIGKMLENRTRTNLVYTIFSLTVGQLAIFALGLAWLSLYVGLSKAFLFGVLPF